MAIRYRKYYQECKDVTCNGRRTRQCPETPKRSSGDYKACGVWCIEFFDDNKQWQSLTFRDIRNKSDAEKRLTLFISDRERGQLNLPKKKLIPTIAEYSQKYLEHCRNGKENTRLLKQSIINSLVRHLGSYPLNKITAFIIEKYRIDRKEKDKVKDSSINVDIAVLSHIFNTAIKAGILDKNPCRDVKKLKVTYRHTFSSLLQSELGVGATVVQGMTGHSSLGMLQKYSHTGLDNKKRAIQALTDHVLTTSKKVNLAIAQ